MVLCRSIRSMDDLMSLQKIKIRHSFTSFVSSLNIKSELLTEASCGLIVFDQSYYQYAKPLIASINLNSPNTKIIVFGINLDESCIKLLGSYSDLINVNFYNEDLNLISESERKAFCANSRASIIAALYKQFQMSSLTYIDVDSLVVNNLSRFIQKEISTKPRLLFRIVKNGYFKKLGFLPFKSGVIVIISPCESNTSCNLPDQYKTIQVQGVLDSYSNYVLDHLFEWFADQRGLVHLSTLNAALGLIHPTGRIINDWNLHPYSFVWSAKGSIKHWISWKVACLLYNKVYQFPSRWRNSSIIRPALRTFNLLAFVIYHIEMPPRYLIRILEKLLFSRVV
ncbi:hypothetical protein SynRS9915_00497 [Synechococcus sp. RS9915]|nr:hypothetical protein SynRS9915_00497 [Synechococcus sp. RS9915]